MAVGWEIGLNHETFPSTCFSGSRVREVGSGRLSQAPSFSGRLKRKMAEIELPPPVVHGTGLSVNEFLLLYFLDLANMYITLFSPLFSEGNAMCYVWC